METNPVFGNIDQDQLQPLNYTQEKIDGSIMQISLNNLSSESIDSEQRATLLTIEIQCEPCLFKQTVKKRLSTLIQLIKQLEEDCYVIIGETKVEDLLKFDFGNEKSLSLVQKSIESFLNEITLRVDFFTNDNIQNFLEIKTISQKEPRMDMSFMPLAMFKELKVQEEELSIHSCKFQDKDSVFLVSLQNQNPLSQLGRIWSLLEPQIIGGLYIYKIDYSFSHLPIFTQVSLQYFEDKILCQQYCTEHKKYIFGSHSGNIYIHEEVKEMVTAGSGKMSFSKFQVSNEEVIELSQLDKDHLFILCRRSIKVFDLVQKQVISGGSLKKRIEGSELLNHIVIPDQKLVLILSSGQEFLVYDLQSLKPEYRSSVKIQVDSVSQMVLKGQNLFFNSQGQIFAYSVKTDFTAVEKVATFRINDNKTFQTQKVTDICIAGKRKIVIAGFESGEIALWNIENGFLFSVIKISKNTIIKIHYIDQSDCVLAIHTHGVKIFKFSTLINNIIAKKEELQQKELLNSEN